MTPITTASRDDSLHTTSFGKQLLWGGVNFSEEFILPEQFFSPVRFQDKYRGEVALLYAILGDAIRCFLGERWERWQTRAQIAREAEAWLFANDTQWPFSFLNICELLDLNPSSLRSHLRRWQQLSPTRKIAPYMDYRTFIEESRPQTNPPALLPRFRKRCQPVRPLHGRA